MRLATGFEQMGHILVFVKVLNKQLCYISLCYFLPGSEGFTDASISRFNGRVCEKELQPWESNSDDGPEESVTLDALDTNAVSIHSFIHSLLAISIAPLQVHYYSEAFLTQRRYCVGVSRQSTTGNCE